MEKTDVVVMLEADSVGQVAESVKSLRQYLKTEVGNWFLFGPRSERLDRLSYDLGLKLASAPSDQAQWGTALASHGESPRMLLWCVDAALTADWHPWNGEKSRVWARLPAVLCLRTELAGWGAACLQGTRSAVWTARQGLHPDAEVLPENQLTEVDAEEYEKLMAGGFRLFAPKAIVLRKKEKTQ